MVIIDKDFVEFVECAVGLEVGMVFCDVVVFEEVCGVLVVGVGVEFYSIFLGVCLSQGPYSFMVF